MPYCENSSRAQIKFRYPEDAEWQSFVSNHPPVDYACSSGFCATCNGASYYAVGTVIADRTSTSPNCRGVAPTTTISPGSYFCIRNISGFSGFHPCTLTLRQELYINCVYAGRAITWTFSGNFVAGNAKFTISDTRGVVFTKIGDGCPIVDVACGIGCPAETACECDCGDTVCCWDANGTPIFSYPK
jgi:hypothetical protein